jgi:4-aminobutyrate aminotransferase-like enzyme
MSRAPGVPMAGPLYERDAEVMMIGNVRGRGLAAGVVSDADVAPFIMW